MAESNRDRAVAHARQARQWVAPTDSPRVAAHLATAHAILAVADELSALRAELAERLGATARTASADEVDQTGPAGDAT